MMCICDISALELYRASGRLLPGLMERSRTAKLEACEIPPLECVRDDLDRLGVRNAPYHLLVREGSHTRKDVVRHVWAKPLPQRSLVRISREVLVVGPELLFYSLALRDDYDILDLVLVGYELCSTYSLDDDPDAWDGFCELPLPLTTTDKISRVLASLGAAKGVRKAREALRYVHDRSNSPMETVMAMLLTMPMRYGGMGFGSKVEMNKPVATSAGTRYVDLVIDGLGLEYKGRKAHSLERVGRDDRRQNMIVGSGVTVLNVWYEDLVSLALFEELSGNVARMLGVRLRIRRRDFDFKRWQLRERTLPAFKRFSRVVG